MPTLPLLKCPDPVAYVVAPVASPRRGRPPAALARLLVVHPVDARRVLSLPAVTVAAWCGVSRQTVARWISAPATMPTAARRLVELYAHGLPPIPPEHWQDKSARGWLQFAFYLDTDTARTPAKQWRLALPGQRPANWCQVHALFSTLTESGRLLERCRRWESRALVAEKEAARLQELIASA